MYTELSVEGTNQDNKAVDRQTGAGPVTDDHRRPSQDDVTNQHAAADDAEGDTAVDEDGKICFCGSAQKTSVISLLI